ncbi:SGNH/GDSL hydrolase family protein [Desulfocurvus vexinensis]|uniref:SGNH/GDSL hydrolase family protein n=1 Tax=Desulfocurvus vexinensis TaxID=399548 RepID=UPI00048D24C4|nr:SGNH/GDSL hydrolase family protein [Desulfocurvus vexinensis]
MQSLGHRSYWNTARKPEGVTRVLCLGDSLTFGQGVLPHEAYPAVLEEHLNRFCWERAVEVVNLGACGHSLHDSVSGFNLRGAAMAPDLVILTLCNNDAELYCTPEGRSYLEHLDRNWDPQGPVFPLFRRALAGFKAGLDAAGVPLVLCFWSVTGECPTDRRVAAQIAGEARALGIDFLDLSLEFTGPQSASADPGLFVSKADEHPSAQAHRLAAMRLARHLLTAGPLAGGDGPPLGEADVARRCADAARAMAAAGRPPEAACSWLLLALGAKRQSRARLRLAPEALLPAPAWEAIVAGVEDELAGLYRLRQHEGFAALIDETPFLRLNSCLGRLEQMHKHCLLLEEATPKSPLLAEPLDMLTRQQPLGGGELLAPDAILARADALLTRALRALEPLRAPAPAPGPWSVLPAPPGETLAPLRAFLEEFALAARGVRRLARRLAAQHARSGRGLGPEHRRGVGLLREHLGGLVLALGGIGESFHLARLAAMRPPLPAAPMTLISATLVMPEGAHGTLRATVSYRQPFRQPVSDNHHGVPDGREHTCRWAFPLLVNATLLLELVGTRGGATLQGVLTRVTINEGHPGALAITPGQAEILSPDRMLVHLALVHPPARV